MADGIEERRLADGSVRYAARVRRRGHRAFSVFDSFPEAQAFRAAVLAAIATGAPLPKRPRPEAAGALRALTVEDAARELVTGMIEGVIRTRRGYRMKPATIEQYERRLRCHVLPRIGAIPITALRRGDVRRMVEELAAEISPSAARLARDALRVTLRRQVELEVLDVNVCTGVATPAEEGTPARFLTPEEADRLLVAAAADASPSIAPVLTLALATGLRRGELGALPWGQEGLDLERERVQVRGTLFEKEVVETKNRKHRTVPIGAATTTAMRRWRLASGRPPDGARVFPWHFMNAWDRTRRRAGLAKPVPRFHDLRHTAATFWLAAGLKSHAVAELLGHADAGLVDRLYGHALPDELASAGVVLERWRAARRA